MALYSVTKIHQDSDFRAHPEGSTIKVPDADVPSIKWIPLDDAAAAAMQKRRDDLLARAEKLAATALAKGKGEGKADAIRAEALDKLAEADASIRRYFAERAEKAPAGNVPVAMSEMGLHRPQSPSDRAASAAGSAVVAEKATKAQRPSDKSPV